MLFDMVIESVSFVHIFDLRLIAEAFYLVSCIFTLESFPTTVSTVVFSFFNYFFQYVKERSFPSVTPSCNSCRKLSGV